MPSEERKHEDFYEPCDLVPRVGENIMLHSFRHPKDTDERCVTLLRTLRKRKAKLAVCPDPGWGVGWWVHLGEGWAATGLCGCLVCPCLSWAAWSLVYAERLLKMTLGELLGSLLTWLNFAGFRSLILQSCSSRFRSRQHL